MSWRKEKIWQCYSEKQRLGGGKMKRKLGNRAMLLGMSMLVAGMTIHSPYGYDSLHFVDAAEGDEGYGAPVPTTYTETVNGIEWSYDVYTGVEEAEYVRPTDKSSLPDTVVIPSVLGGFPVTRIGSDAFSGSKVKSITVPDSVSVIEAAAFADCESLTELQLPNKTFGTIYGAAFRNCKALTEISARFVNDYAFQGCTNLKRVEILSVSYHPKVEIAEGVFQNCTSLQEVIFSDFVTEVNIKSHAFQGCALLKNINFYNANVTLYKEVFADCSALASLTINGTITAKAGAFKNCSSLSSITFLQDAKLGKEMFEGCSSLKKLSLQGENIELTLDCKWQVEVIELTNAVKISGSIQSANQVKKLVFSSKNPNLDDLTCEAGMDFVIEGYREIGAMAEQTGHDTVYQWAKKNGLEKFFTSLGTFTGEIKESPEPMVSHTPVISHTPEPTATNGPATTTEPTAAPAAEEVHTVSFDANGGTIDGIVVRLKKTYKNKKVYGALMTPEREGYRFLGWYTQIVGGERITKNTTVLSKYSTLYARWNKIKVGKGKITKLSNLTARRIKVAIGKNGTVSGYELVYADNRQFENKVSKKIAGGNKVYHIKKVKKGKTYYVKIRAYQLDSAGEKVYGSYSSVKKMKVKG